MHLLFSPLRFTNEFKGLPEIFHFELGLVFFLLIKLTKLQQVEENNKVFIEINGQDFIFFHSINHRGWGCVFLTSLFVIIICLYGICVTWRNKQLLKDCKIVINHLVTISKNAKCTNTSYARRPFAE